MAARADDGKRTEATVLTFEGGAIVIDLGAASGAHPGDLVELWRPIRVKHPITGKMLLDRFRVGSLKLVQVQAALSLAEPAGLLAEPPKAGDIVVVPAAPAPVPVPIIAPAKDQPVAPPSAAPPASASTPVLASSAPVAGPPPLWKPIGGVERRSEALPEPPHETPEVLGWTPPTSALSQRPLTIAIELATARAAVLHVRRKTDVAYVSTPMRRLGAHAFAATLAASQMTTPGLAYFIEAVDAAGTARPIVGTAESPEDLAVADPEHVTAPLAALATAGLSVDYARFNLARNNDELTQTEGFVGLRFHDDGLRAIRTGFGVYRGKGGSLDDLDRLGKSPRSVGLTYGWLELEHGLAKDFSFIGRGIVGVGDDGITGGAQAFLRIGSDLGTNLLVGGEILGGVGVRGITELDLAVFPRVPIALRTEVTNEPAGFTPSAATAAGTSSEVGEVAVRAIAQVGYRITPAFAVFARGSYQGRTIDHSGPGAGAAVTYSW